ncbi:MAG TPA: tRNA pseudouridine(38-40) synthase TruA [Salinimicrobium sp.]|nr:tRNA pseudouridine(38-40) synthase TruA [Salinimicrobium sp.]
MNYLCGFKSKNKKIALRYFLELAYMGKAYHGWQKQPNVISVQEMVENSLFTIVRKPIEIVAAGRTDAGVHAKQIFAHFDYEEKPDPDFVFKLNSLLPKDIAVLNIWKVKLNAHARFDAISRAYEYHIVQKKDPFAFEASYLIKRKLDVELMNLAAKILLEYTNFKSFSRSRTDVKTYNCNIESAFWEKKDDRLIFHIKANRFLRNMVRAIVGTLLEIGLGKMQIEEMHKIIESQNRSAAGASVPAHGLYLTEIKYPKQIFLD